MAWEMSFEICIMLRADHGPCVSNTIVTARAGKDLISSLVSGGAIDDAARYSKDACDKSVKPYDFVEGMKEKGIRVPGIRHSRNQQTNSSRNNSSQQDQE